MLELVLQFLVEILVQVFAEILVELGFHSLKEPLRRRPSPWVAIPGYVLIGGATGALSVLFFPEHFIPDGAARIAVVLLVPVLAGLLMSAIGAWRTRRGDAVLRIDRFSYGYLFALCFALARYLLAA